MGTVQEPESAAVESAVVIEELLVKVRDVPDLICLALMGDVRRAP